MKRNALKILLGGALTLGLLLVGVETSRAGHATTSRVTVNTSADGSGFVFGSVSGARYSSDSTQFIGCSLHANAAGTSSGTCSAMDAEGTYFGCRWSNPPAAVVAAIASIGPQSRILFNVNADGSCSNMSVTQASYYLR
jgi:hypothetical protein